MIAALSRLRELLQGDVGVAAQGLKAIVGDVVIDEAESRGSGKAANGTSLSFPETSPPATIATPDYGDRNLEPEATLPAEPARGLGRSRPVADGRRPLTA